jgi:TPR repeat protein
MTPALRRITLTLIAILNAPSLAPAQATTATAPATTPATTPVVFDPTGLHDQSLAAIQAAAARDDAMAQVELAMRYHQGRDLTKDDTLAVGWYQKAADQNNPIAQFGLGIHYIDGTGVTMDETRGVALVTKASDQRPAHDRSCFTSEPSANLNDFADGLIC